MINHIINDTIETKVNINLIKEELVTFRQDFKNFQNEIINHNIESDDIEWDEHYDDDDIKIIAIPVKTKPSNSMYWFRGLWKTDRENMVTKYCTPDMMDKLAEHMKSDDNKNKIDDIKSEAEYKFIWTNYCSAKIIDHTLRDKIRKDYENFCVEFDKQNQTVITDNE